MVTPVIEDSLKDRSFVTSLLFLTVFVTTGCSLFTRAIPQAPPPKQRLTAAVLEFGMGIDITRLSSIRSVNGEVPPDQEPVQVREAVREIQLEARRLLYQRLQASEHFQLVSFENTDKALEGLGLEAGDTPSSAQLAAIRNRLGVDVLISGTVLDYGKVRWQWLAAGMLTDTSAESIAIGLATAWNPVALAANIGFNLLTREGAPEIRTV